MSEPLPRAGGGLEALRRFATIRLIALDIDGTLLSTTHGGIGEVLRDLQASLANFRRGVRLTIATGRTFTAAQAVVEDLGLSPHTMVVLYNGAVVTTASGDGMWMRRLIDQQTVQKVIDFGATLGLRTYVFSCDAALVSGYERSGRAVAESVMGVASDGSGPGYFGGLPVYWAYPTAPPSTDAAAVLLELRPGLEAAYVRVRLMDAKLPIVISASSERYIEVSPMGSSKAIALEGLARSLNIARPQVAAVGDNENDVDMLKWAGVGIAVRNATPRAVEASDFVTRYNAGDGVVELLRLVRAAVRYRSVVN